MNRVGEKGWVLKLAAFLKSDTLAVLICIIGAGLQSVHTYFIMYYSSRVDDEFFRVFQAVGVGIFFSFSLLYWTLRAGSYNPALTEHVRPRMKALRYAHGLFVFESLVNMHYWTKEFIIVPMMETSFAELDLVILYDWSATVVISFALPWMIKTYAGQVNMSSVF